MKSSAATKTFRIPSINEHRLSVGLLVLLLLCGAGYLIWLGIASFLPAASLEKTESRNRVADRYVENGDWGSAIQVYQEMLKDDPENGYAAARIAQGWQTDLEEKWDRYANLSENTGNARAAGELLAQESEIFNSTIGSWQRLRDNARYQRNAYEQMASLHGRRSVILDSSEDVEKAAAIIDEMLEKGLVTAADIESTRALDPLKSHPDYDRFREKEARIKRANSRRSFLRSRGLSF